MAIKQYLPTGDVRDVIALVLVGTVVYLSVTGQVIPDLLVGLAGTAVGYYFAQRENDNDRAHEERMRRIGGQNA